MNTASVRGTVWHGAVASGAVRWYGASLSMENLAATIVTYVWPSRLQTSCATSSSDDFPPVRVRPALTLVKAIHP